MARDSTDVPDKEGDDQGQVYVTDADLADRYRVHRTTIWRWARTGHLPKPIHLGPGVTRWRTGEIHAFEADRSEARD